MKPAQQKEEKKRKRKEEEKEKEKKRKKKHKAADISILLVTDWPSHFLMVLRKSQLITNS